MKRIEKYIMLWFVTQMFICVMVGIFTKEYFPWIIFVLSIAFLFAYVYEITKPSKPENWISLDDELPLPGTSYKVKDVFGNVFNLTCEYPQVFCDVAKSYKVTHWLKEN